MSENAELLKRLGLASLNVASQDSIVDAQKQTHPVLKNYKIDIINDGTLQNTKAKISLLGPIKGTPGTSFYKEYQIDPASEGYYVETESSLPVFGQLSFYNPSKESHSLIGNNYFNIFTSSFKSKDQIKIRGIDENLSYVRLVFNNGNTNQINGFYNKQGNKIPIQTQDLTSVFSGKEVANTTSNFRLWGENRLPGESGVTNLNNFYLSYPNTVSTWNYNGYNIPTKLACFMKNEASGIKDLNGILLISTGTAENEKICYISPHKATTGLYNTIIFGKEDKTITRHKGVSISPRTFSEKVPFGVIVYSIVLGSEFLEERIFPSGIRLVKSGDYKISNDYSFNGFIKNYPSPDGFYPKDWSRPYTIDSNQHLRQQTPIKNTAFYEAYSGIYNGNRTFNTGTWDGIIPARTPFKIELISSAFNEDAGTNHIIYPIYSGFGLFNEKDIKIHESLSSFNSNLDGTEFNNTKVKISEDKNIISMGRGRGDSLAEAYDKAKENLKFINFNKHSNIIKKNVPEILQPNRTLRRFMHFLQDKKQKISNYSITTQSVVIDTPVIGLPPIPDEFIEQLGYSYVSINENFSSTTAIGNSVKFYELAEVSTIILNDGTEIKTPIYFSQSSQYALWAKLDDTGDDIMWMITAIDKLNNTDLSSYPNYFRCDSNIKSQNSSGTPAFYGYGIWDGLSFSLRLKAIKEITGVTADGYQGGAISQLITDAVEYETAWKNLGLIVEPVQVDFSLEAIMLLGTRGSALNLRARENSYRQLNVGAISTANIMPRLKYIFGTFAKKDWDTINGNELY